MRTIFIFAILLSSISSFAGPGHGHSHAKKKGHGHAHGSTEISMDKALTVAKTEINRLIKKGKLDPSWKESNYNSSEKKKFGSNTEWVVTFDNEKGVKGKRLYVFLSLSGEFIAANFTGK